MISCFKLKPYVKCFPTCLKGFKLKKLVVEQKTTKPIEPDEELVEPSTQPIKGCKKPSLLFKTVVQSIKV